MNEHREGSERTAPEWLTPGADVAEYGYRGRHPVAVVTEVERLTKTLVVLSNGSRYPLRSLHRSGGGAWEPSRWLMAYDDPAVQRALRVARAQVVAQRIQKLASTLYDHPEDLSPLLDIHRLCEAWSPAPAVSGQPEADR